MKALVTSSPGLIHQADMLQRGHYFETVQWSPAKPARKRLMEKLNAEISSKVNRSMVLSKIYQHPLTSRVELAGLTGLGQSAITHILKFLVAEGLVEEVAKEEPTARKGRRRIQLRTRANSRFIIALEVDLQWVRAVMVNLDGEPVHEERVEYARHTPLLDILRRALVKLREAAPEKYKLAVIIGVSASGAVDPYHGTVVRNIYHEWDNVPVVEVLRKEFHLPAFVENNAKVAALGELHHLARKGQHIDSLIYVYVRENPSGRASLPLAIGGAAVLGGEVWHGAHYHAGEIARFINAPFMAFMEDLLKKRPQFAEVSFSDLVAQAEGGDDGARQVLLALADRIGAALGMIATFLDPEAALVHFRPESGNQYLLGEIERAFHEHYQPVKTTPVPLLRPVLGGEAAIPGIVHLALEHIFIKDTSQTSILIS